MFGCRFLALVDVRTIYRDHAKHASPVEWCLKEKVLLGKWSAIAMLELQRIPFAGWASPVKWCLNEKVELLCKLAMPRLSSGV